MARYRRAPRGCSLVVKRYPSKIITGVRFPVLALVYRELPDTTTQVEGTQLAAVNLHAPQALRRCTGLLPRGAGLDTLVAHAGMMGTGIPGSLKMIRLRVRIPLPVPAALVLRGPEAAWMMRWLAANAFLR